MMASLRPSESLKMPLSLRRDLNDHQATGHQFFNCWEDHLQVEKILNGCHVAQALAIPTSSAWAQNARC